ncbi:MAG: flagellar basal-body MS-ring/collar protein FliF [Terriglobia bacterium]
MPLDTSQVLRQGKTFVRGLTDRQKALITISMIAVAGSLWLFVSLLGRGDYVLLYSGLDATEASTITRRLADKGIPSQMSADGKSLSVPAGRLDKARLDMAAEGLPQTGRLGFEIFDKPNWGESDFAEKVNYQRALEGELERTIQELNDVEAVRVHLVMPHESLFSDRERQAKASVLVKLRNGHLSERSLKAITYLVASAVDTLQPANVTVVDADGNVPIVMHGGVKPGSPEGATEYEQALNQKLAATLTPIVGANHFVARATVEYDPGSSENTQEIYDPKDSVVLTSQVTGDDIGDGSQDSGIPGAASNVPQNQTSSSNSSSAAGAQSSSAAGASSSDSNSASDDDDGDETSDSKTYAVGRTVVHSVRPPGTIQKISAAILVDDATETKVVSGQKMELRQPRTSAELKQIQAIAAAVLGLDPARGDLVTVENIPFQITPLQPAGPISGFKRIQPFLNQYGYLVRYIVLALLGLLLFLFVVKPLMRQVGAGAHQRPLPEATEPAPALEESRDLLSGTAGRELAAMSSAGDMPEGNQQRQKVKALKEALVARVAKTPAEASYVIGDWLKEGG